MRLRVLALALVLGAGLASQGQTYQVLLSFNGSDGGAPYAPLARDAAGNLYGTTIGDGAYGGGVVFMLTPPYTSSNITVLYSFGAFPGDGTYPLGTVAIGSDGSLYGTTQYGGIYQCGTAYRLTPSGGMWNYQVMHSFGAPGDGQRPDTTPVVDAAGNVYGTTLFGGTGYVEDGVAYELSPQSNNSYSETIIYNFDNTDGYLHGDLVREGNMLYGPAFGGGNGPGAVYVLSKSSGVWSKKNVYTFLNHPKTCCPVGISFDSAGNIFAVSQGSLLAIPRNKDGSFGPERVLGTLNTGKTDPYGIGRPAIDALGNVYATTADGGINNHGTVWKFSQSGNGGWAGTLLHEFNDDGSDGFVPVAGPIVDNAGNVYGTTASGGVNVIGTVWEISP